MVLSELPAASRGVLWGARTVQMESTRFLKPPSCAESLPTWADLSATEDGLKHALRGQMRTVSSQLPLQAKAPSGPA